MRNCFIWLVVMSLCFGFSGIAQGERAPSVFQLSDASLRVNGKTTSAFVAFRSAKERYFRGAKGDFVFTTFLNNTGWGKFEAQAPASLTQAQSPQDSYWQYYADCDRWEVEFDTQWIETEAEFAPADSGIAAKRLKPVEPSLTAAVLILARNSERLSEQATTIWQQSPIRKMILDAEFQRVETRSIETRSIEALGQSASLLPIDDVRNAWRQMTRQIELRWASTYSIASNSIKNQQRQFGQTVDQWLALAQTLPQRTIRMADWAKSPGSIGQTFRQAKFQRPARSMTKPAPTTTSAPMSAIRIGIADGLDWMAFRMNDLADHVRPPESGPDSSSGFERSVIARRTGENHQK